MSSRQTVPRQLARPRRAAADQLAVGRKLPRLARSSAGPVPQRCGSSVGETGPSALPGKRQPKRRAGRRTIRAPGRGEHDPPPPAPPTRSRQEERWSQENIASTSAPVTGWAGPVSEAGIKGRRTSGFRCNGALLVSMRASTNRRIKSAGVAPSCLASVSNCRRTASGSSTVACIPISSHGRVGRGSLEATSWSDKATLCQPIGIGLQLQIPQPNKTVAKIIVGRWLTKQPANPPPPPPPPAPPAPSRTLPGPRRNG